MNNSEDFNRISLQNALYKGDFNHAFEKVQDNFSLIKSNITELTDYSLRIGSSSNNKAKADKIDSIILSTGTSFTDTMNYIKDIKDFNYDNRTIRLETVKKAKDLEDMLLRYKKKFEDLVNKIKNQNIQLIDSARNSFRMSNASNPKLSNNQLQMNGREYLEGVEEKEKTIAVIKQVTNQLNELSKQTADIVIQGAKKIDTIDENVGFVEKNVSNAVKSMESAKKLNESTGGYTNKLLYLVVGLVLFLIIIAFLMPKD